MANYTFMRPMGTMQPVGQVPGYGPQPSHYHGFCPSCHHPVDQCVCHRSCRKVEKELLALPGLVGTKPHGELDPTTGASIPGLTKEATLKRIFGLMDFITPIGAAEDTGDTNTAAEKAATSNISMKLISELRRGMEIGKIPYGVQTTVIGGGCCVHLSMEYMPIFPAPMAPLATTLSMSAAMVMDSKGIIMGWGKVFTDEGHHVKESIISTNPGAWLLVLSVNSVTRVRWCEIISC